jgi:hypothetical protein
MDDPLLLQCVEEVVDVDIDALQSLKVQIPCEPWKRYKSGMRSGRAYLSALRLGGEVASQANVTAQALPICQGVVTEILVKARDDIASGLLLSMALLMLIIMKSKAGKLGRGGLDPFSVSSADSDGRHHSILIPHPRHDDERVA